MQNLVDVATKFLCGRTWQHAFEQTGLLGDRSHLTRDLAAVEPELQLLQQPVRLPTLPTVRQMLPQDCRVPYSQLLSEPLGRSIRVRLF